MKTLVKKAEKQQPKTTIKNSMKISEKKAEKKLPKLTIKNFMKISAKKAENTILKITRKTISDKITPQFKTFPTAEFTIEFKSFPNLINFIRSEEHTSNSRHVSISYAVFCLKKKKTKTSTTKRTKHLTRE